MNIENIYRFFSILHAVLHRKLSNAIEWVKQRVRKGAVNIIDLVDV